MLFLSAATSPVTSSLSPTPISAKFDSTAVGDFRIFRRNFFESRFIRNHDIDRAVFGLQNDFAVVDRV